MAAYRQMTIAVTGRGKMAKVTLTVPIEIDAKQILDWFKGNDVVAVVRCNKCAYWDRDTIFYQNNGFRSWNEAECKILAERGGYNEIDRYTEADDYCSHGEEKDG